MKTFMANAATIEKKWYVVDVEGKVLGRAASEVAKSCVVSTNLNLHLT